MQFRMVVVSGDRSGRERLARLFRSAGFRVIIKDAVTALALSLEEPDLVVLDLGAAPITGLADVRAMSRTLGVPVIALLATPSEQAELMCFNAGARDVVLRTVSPAVLVARARAVLPLCVETPAHGVLRVGPLSIDRDARRALCGDRFLNLRPAESTLLEAFMARPRHVLERASLKRIVWGGECSDRALESTVSRVRSAVLAAGGPRIIVPVRGVGYRLGLD